MTRGTRERVAEYATRHRDATAPAILGALALEPTEQNLELAREAVAARERLDEREAVAEAREGTQ